MVDERVRFVRRLLEGETMTTLCEEFGISRKTGYKIFQRYQRLGVRGLSDRSRRPYRHANQLPVAVESAIVRLKREYPDVGRAQDSRAAAAALAGHLVPRHQHRPRRARSPRPGHAPAATPAAAPDGHAARPAGRANGLWCADYKGEFLLRNQRYCYPLTITDFATRYLLACEALSTTQERYAFRVFERAFQEFGLPDAVRTDNGVPFASAHALYGLSKLAVWWLRLGIRLERIAPGPSRAEWPARAHAPDFENGSDPARRGNVLQQQMRFDTFVDRFNRERPHQALDMATPASRYTPRRAPTRASRTSISVPRLDGRRDPLRSHLLPAAEDQSQSGVCGQRWG